MSNLETEKYSISPNSGRLRKRIKKKSNEERGIFAKRLDNFSYNSKLVFALILIVLVGIMLVIFNKFQDDKEEVQIKYMPNQYKYENPNKPKTVPNKPN
jgi:hypothetical protein